MLTLPLAFQVLINGLTLSSIYIMVALGFTMIFGIMRVINFAHGEFAMLGGYLLLVLFGWVGLPFLVALPAAILAFALASLVLEQTIYQRFYQKEMQGMIATLGVSIALTYAVVIVFDTHEQVVPPYFSAIFVIGSVVITADRVFVIAVTSVTLTAFFLFMRYSRLGLAMRVVAQDFTMAQIQGINARATFRIAFFIASALAALAGALLGQLYSVTPFMGGVPLVKAFTVVILGGLGSIPGAAIGGLILGMGESVTSTFFGSSVAQFASFGLVLLVLLARPNGLLGEKNS
jgi:branched-chain amino acid transport system permease protein